MIGRVRTMLALLSVACLLAAPGHLALGAGAAPAAGQSDVDKLFDELAKYDFGQSEKVLVAVGDLVLQAKDDPDKRKDIEARLIGLLTTGTPACKRFICREAWMAGSARMVPALAKLLTDAQLSDAARYGLERMADPAAGEALRQAAAKLQGKLLIGVIDSLGFRRDRDAEGLLLPLLTDESVAVRAAAAWALARIGTPQAAKALAAQRAKAQGLLSRVLDDAYLLSADGLTADGKTAEAVAVYREMYADAQPRRIRIAALRGLVTAQPDEAGAIVVEALKSPDAQLAAVAGRLVSEVQCETIMKALAGQMASLPPDRQVVVLEALGRRGDSAARPAVLAAVDSKDANVQAAALRALGSVGSAQDVGRLADVAAGPGGPARDAARAGLASLRGEGVEPAMLGKIAAAQPPVRVVLIEALAARGAPSALAGLLKLLADKDESVARAAIAGVGALGGPQQIPTLADLVVASASAGIRDTAADAVGTIARRMGDKDKAAQPLLAVLPGAADAPRAVLIRLLGQIGGPTALDAVRAALKDKDEHVQEAAVRALAAWDDDRPAADLLALAKDAADKNRGILALRGYVRMVRLNRGRPAQEAVAMYEQAMKLASRPQEIKEILSGLAEVRDPGALKLIEPCLDNPELVNEAAAAAVKVAAAVNRSDHARAVEAARKVLAVAKDKRVLDEARKIAGGR